MAKMVGVGKRMMICCWIKDVPVKYDDKLSLDD